MLSRDVQLPAVSADGNIQPTYNTGEIAYGDLIAIPPEASGGPNLDSLGLSEGGKRLAEAIRNYGIYVTDGTGSNCPALRTDQFVANVAQLKDDLTKVYPHLRVVLNGAWTPGLSAVGGGIPLAPNCAFDAPTTGTGASSSTGSAVVTTSGDPVSGPDIVAKYPPRTVYFEANRTGGGFQERYRFTPADQYYLDYTLRFHNEFDWDTRPQVQGKIPGLAGGGQNGGGNCTGSAPDAWSARSMFHQDGAMKAYLYYSNKTSTCGDKQDWTNPNGGGIFKFTKNRYYRVTQRIKINTPNVSNGEIEMWVDGQRVFSRNNMRWRGAVSPSVARVDQVMYQAFFGGESINHTPTYRSSMDFGWMYVMSCAPDFTKAPGTCQ